MKPLSVFGLLLALTASAAMPSFGAARLQQAELVVPSVTLQAQAKSVVHYLAIRPGSPVDKSLVPVSDKATIQKIIASAKRKDKAAYTRLASSKNVNLMVGGATITVLKREGQLTQVKVHARDFKGVDVSGKIKWTPTVFVQSMEL
jgi:hypothetical protein